MIYDLNGLRIKAVSPKNPTMALFTPRGLKVRLPINYAFGLMARLYPDTDAFRVLQRTEEVENLDGLATFIAALTAFYLRLDPMMIGVVVATTSFVFKLVHLAGLFVPPFTFLLPVSRIYSWFSGNGVFLIGLLIFGWFVVGWKGILAYFLGRIAAAILVGVIDLWWSRFVFKKTGVSVTASERSFFHAYRLEANKLGRDLSLEVSNDELDEGHWMPTFLDLQMKWPVVTSRFTPD